MLFIYYCAAHMRMRSALALKPNVGASLPLMCMCPCIRQAPDDDFSAPDVHLPEGLPDDAQKKWRLSEMIHPRSQQLYLLDNESWVLYLSDYKTGWPQVSMLCLGLGVPGLSLVFFGSG